MDDGVERQQPSVTEAFSRDQLAGILSGAADVVFDLDPDGIVHTIADTGASTLGYSPDRIVGESVGTILATDSAATPAFDVTTTAQFRDAVLEEPTQQFTAPFRSSDGDVVGMAVSTVENADRVVCVARELDDEAVLGRSAEVLDVVPDPVYVLDADGAIERVNDALVEYTGYDRSELLGRAVTDLLPAADQERTLERLLGGDDRTATVETTLVTDDGQRILTEAHLSGVTDGAGEYAGAVGVLRDIRARKRRARDLELLKQVLTRVFRHNVRNDLTVVRGHADILQTAVDESLHTHTDEIVSKADRLLSHAEKVRTIEEVVETDERYEMDLAALAAEAASVTREEHPAATIDLEVPDPVPVDAHPAIHSAVQELLDNAAEHAPDGESPRIEVWIDRQADATTLFVEDESGGLADHEVNVLRSGDERDLEHSSGVGLWLVRWVVEHSGAEMIVHPTDGGSLMGIRFVHGGDEPPADVDESPITRAPERVREVSPETFRGEAVVGRVDALHELEDVYEALQRTGGQSVLVTGEPGIGKTTLVDQFRDRLDREDPSPAVATGFCDAEIQPPYHAFRQVLSDLPGERDMSELLSDATALSAEDPDQLQDRKEALFAKVADELREVAADRPVVVLIEDMHWADQGTIDLYDYLLEDVGRWGRPVLFLGTYRTSDVDRAHPVLEIARETSEAGRGTVLELDPLGHDEVETLVSHVLGVERVPDRFVTAVEENTGGTPLFVNELVRHLSETLGPITAVHDVPESLEDVSLPETVDDAVAARLEALPEEAMPTLRLGAVLGPEFSFDVLRAASDVSTDRLLEHIETLVDRDVWARSADGVEFCHGVIRDQTLEATVDPRRLHEKAAAAIEAVHSDELAEHAGRLGTHYEVVGEYETAFEYYRQAGSRATGTYANEEAIDHYERALSLAEEHGVADDRAVASLHTNLGDALETVAEYDRASDQYERGLELCRAIGDRETEAESLLGLATVAKSRSDYDRALGHYEDALGVGRELNDRQVRAESLAGIGNVHRLQGTSERAREAYERGLEIAVDTGDRQAETSILNGLGILEKQLGNYDSAAEYYERSLAVSREVGDRLSEAKCLGNLGNTNKRRGEYDRAQEYLEQSIERFRDIGDRKNEAKNLHNLGLIADTQDQLDSAKEYYERSLKITQEIGAPRIEAASLDSLGTIAEAQNEHERARERHLRSLDIHRSIEDPIGEGLSLVHLAEVALTRGHYDSAREYAEEGLEIFREIEFQKGESANLRCLGVSTMRREQYDRASEHLIEALDVAKDGGMVRQETQILLDLSALERKRGNLDRAADFLDECLARSDDTDFQGHLSNAHLERARLALERDDVGTAREAVERAADRVSGSDDTYQRANVELLSGRIAAGSGDSETARERLRSALDTFEEIDTPNEALETLHHLVETCLQRNERDRATEWYGRARETFERAPEPVQELHREWVDDGVAGRDEG